MLSPAHPFWGALTPDIQNTLLLGSVGKLHIVGLAEAALRNASQGPPEKASFFASLGLDLLLAAWEDDPLDGHLASQLLTLQSKLSGIPAHLHDILRYVDRAWRQPAQNAYYSRLLQRREPDKLHRFLEQMLVKEPNNLYWWQQALAFGCFGQDWEWLDNCLGRYWPEEQRTLKAVIQGDLERIQNLPVNQEALHLKIEHAQSRAASQKLLGDLALAEGDPEKALNHWMTSLRLRPWQTSLLLKVHDQITRRDRQTAALYGKTVILLYSFNKADELALTLTSLADSELNGATITVLDNASTDQTASLLRQWTEQLGPKRLQIVSLPVNIGAPAARNWLMHLPQCREADWIAYLDDDVSLPTDWLLRLGAAVENYPQAGVWGCKVVDFQNPMSVQSADLHVLSLERSDREGHKEGWTSFKLSNLHHQILDHAQFSYVRPCTSVTGCCHLFSRDVLLECGDFDLRFSPSQFDDLDHDLRLALAGRPAVFQGHLMIRHMKQTGRATLNNPLQYGNAMANEYKLHNKYTQNMVERIATCNQDVVRHDLITKAIAVAKTLDFSGWINTHDG
jgi:GT2 family glycosyltransferase